jgi:hypothetical protein
MSNVEKLKAAGVVPHDHKLTDGDHSTIENLSDHEVQSLINLKQKLGDEFVKRNTRDTPNCFI